MSNFNMCILEGNMTADPEVSYTSNGSAVAAFNVAVNRKYKDNESVLFMPCVCFGKLAEIVIKYAGKGKKVLVSGYLQDDSFEGTDGQTRHRVKLYLDTVRLLGAPISTDRPDEPASRPDEPVDEEF